MPAALGDGVERGGQRAHVIPVAVRHGDLLDLAEIDRHVAAVADEGRALGAGVEQQRVLLRSDLRPEAQAIAEVGHQQRLAGDFLGAGLQDVGHLRHRERGLARVGVAHIVGDDVHDQRIDGGENGHSGYLPVRVQRGGGARSSLLLDEEGDRHADAQDDDDDAQDLRLDARREPPPNSPPMNEPIPSAMAADQTTMPEPKNSTAAVTFAARLTVCLTALMRGRVSDMTRPIRASTTMPRPAPKKPPYSAPMNTITASAMSLPIWAARVEARCAERRTTAAFDPRFDGQQERGGEDQPGHEAFEGRRVGPEEQPAAQQSTQRRDRKGDERLMPLVEDCRALGDRAAEVARE